MRISDWSSDVCSSDLPASMTGRPGRNFRVAGLGVDSVSISMRRMWDASALCARWYTCARIARHSALAACKWQLPALPVLPCRKHAALRVLKTCHFRLDPKSVGEDIRVSERVGPGGLRVIKKKETQ